MSENVIIKSYPNGISIHLMPEVSFVDLLNECERKFKESEKFFKGARLAVSFEGRKLDFEQEKALIEVISNACKIQIVCVVGKDDETDEFFTKGLDQFLMEQSMAKAQFLKGSLKKGEHFETNESVIVLGDVAKEATIISKKDIIVLGKLYGEAHAGVDGRNHFIAALDFAPTGVKIAGLRSFKPAKTSSLWGKKQKSGPKMAYLAGGQILTKEIEFTEELLESLQTS